jgi:FtsH-binding integral membrane protein
MAYGPDFRAYPSTGSAASSAATLDAGLRAYMMHVYNWMASGLLVTGIVAYACNAYLLDLFYPLTMTPRGLVHAPSLLAYASMFAPLAFVMVLSFGVNRLSSTAAKSLFWLFAAAMGASMMNIFLVYTGESIVRVFFITAGTFAAMSLWGYTTRSDLSRMASFLVMGLVGIIIAGLVNMFVGSSMLQFAISVIGVIVFTGLTAYDTQRIKAGYLQNAYMGGAMLGKQGVYDALSLYLNFINLFMMILQLTGDRRSN